MMPSFHIAKIPRRLSTAGWSLLAGWTLWGGPGLPAVRDALQLPGGAGACWILHLMQLPMWTDRLLMILPTGNLDMTSAAGLRLTLLPCLIAVIMSGLIRIPLRRRLRLCAAALGLGLCANILLPVLCAGLYLFSRGTYLPVYAAFLQVTLLVTACTASLALVIRASRNPREPQAPAAPDPGLTTAITTTPPPWQQFLSRVGYFLFPLTLAAVIILAAWLNQPSHRQQLVEELVFILNDSGRVDDAAHVARALARRYPDDSRWHRFMVSNSLRRGAYQETLRHLAALAPESDRERHEAAIWKAVALTGLGQPSAARAAVAGIPASAWQTDPALAMLMSEWAALTGDIFLASACLPVAAGNAAHIPRIRRLYPFLQAHSRWTLLAQIDSSTSYATADAAIAMMEAYMNLNRLDELGNRIGAVLNDWPAEPRLIYPLFYLAQHRASWQPRFKEYLLHYVQSSANPRALAELIEPCLILHRPDLAWQVCRRLRELDPRHPALAMMAAQYGHLWFKFRWSDAPAGEPDIDLEPYFLLAHAVPRYADFAKSVPFGRELARAGLLPVRREKLQEALQEFESRQAAGTLSLAQCFEYAHALSMAGRLDAAVAELNRILHDYPQEALTCHTLLALFYEQRGAWQEVYEALRPFAAENAEGQMVPMLLLSETYRRFHMLPAALETAQAAFKKNPDSLSAQILAEALLQNGKAEAALDQLAAYPIGYSQDLDRLRIQALFQTQRYTTVNEVQPPWRFPVLPLPETQSLRLAAAEEACNGPLFLNPSPAAFAAAAANATLLSRSDQTPFLSGLAKEWLKTWNGAPADLAAWEACGRNTREKAAALHQLALLSLHQGKTATAIAALQAAIRHMPGSAPLWQSYIALSGKDAAVIHAARTACPDDEDIWLADFVARMENQSPVAAPDMEARLQQELKTDATRLSAATLTRAGEFLERRGLLKAADLAALLAEPKANGLLPVYVFAERRALAKGDHQLALDGLRRAMNAAVQPPLFFQETFARLLAMEYPLNTSDETSRTLQTLVTQEPENPLWLQLQGYLFLQRGGMDLPAAFRLSAAAVKAGATNATPFLVAAEAARRLGDLPNAIAMLQEGLRHHPDHLAMQNNLVDLLSLEPATLAQAGPLLTDLLMRAPADPAILDTAAGVYLQQLKFTEAEKILDRLQLGAAPFSPRWTSSRLRRAEMALLQKKWAETERIAREIIKNGKGLSNDQVHRAQLLLVKSLEGQPAPPSWFRHRGTEKSDLDHYQSPPLE